MSKKPAQAKREEASNARRARTRLLTGIVAGIALLALLATVLVPLLSGGGGERGDADAGTQQDSPEQGDSEQPTHSDAPMTGDVSASTVAPDPALAEDRMWEATLVTSQGDITVELDGAAAPQAVASFVALAGEGFFEQTDCHRVVTAGIFVLQCGDPSGNGTGGPGYRFGPIENAPADDLYPAGTLAMARVGNNAESMGSQFFIVYEDSVIPSDGAGGYTVFGQVTEGLSIVGDVANAGTITGEPDGRPAQSVIVNEVHAS